MWMTTIAPAKKTPVHQTAMPADDIKLRVKKDFGTPGWQLGSKYIDFPRA
jgi:hypothetical protein